ncbi:MAG: hypothetical protein KDA61_19800, partial [Planctomycetales bacterium]|nr:hypothetical protein [Planctomycetales bacterium]
RGGNGGGGETLIDIQDQGSLRLQQDLHMTLGTDADAKSTLKVRGPDATVEVIGNLNMALDPFGVANLGSATLHAVITAATHSTIEVGGNVNIDNGNLVVELDGYTPTGGESYELIHAGSVSGTAFKLLDTTTASLLEGLSWEVAVSGGSVFLNVLGSSGDPGDFNHDGRIDGADFLAWQNGFGGAYNSGDLSDWASGFGAAAAAANAAAVPEPAAIGTSLCLAVSAGAIRRRRHK